jgi:hypothetical protein
MTVSRRKTEPAHPLVGAGVHYKDENGVVQNQAAIVAVIPGGGHLGDLALLQYFEWFTGSPSTRRLVSLSELAASDRWVLYRDVDEMNDHYERVDNKARTPAGDPGR